MSRCVSRAWGRHRGEYSWIAPGTKALQEGFSEEEESPVFVLKACILRAILSCHGSCSEARTPFPMPEFLLVASILWPP